MERLSVSEREVLWDWWEAGESQRSISRRLGRSPTTVRTHLASSGWRRPTPPGEWCSVRLSLSEREEISRGLSRDESLRSIAHRLGRSPSTVSREVKNQWGSPEVSGHRGGSGVEEESETSETDEAC